VHTCTVTYPAALDPTSLPMRASVLPRVTRLWTPPPCLGGLRCCHVSHGFGPHFPAREGSSGVMCPTTPDTTSLLGRAPALSRV
jgi:hypothetical protein